MHDPNTADTKQAYYVNLTSFVEAANHVSVYFNVNLSFYKLNNALGVL